MGKIKKYAFSASDVTECIGLVLTQNSYINLIKLHADCIRQIIGAVRARIQRMETQARGGRAQTCRAVWYAL